MGNKEKFCKEFEDLGFLKQMSEESQKYFTEVFCAKSTKKKTETTLSIINFLQNNVEKSENGFTAKLIGDNVGLSAKAVAGAMRNLINEGLVEKKQQVPVIYKITNKGLNFKEEN